MISTMFNGQNCFLLNDHPDWSSPVESQFTLTRDKQISLTRHETRRPYSSTLLTKLTYTASVGGAALRQLLGAIRQLNTQPVIVPFWPAIANWGNRANVALSGGLRIAWRADWSQYSIDASTDPEPLWPLASDFWAPALMGFLTPDSSPAIRRDTQQLKINFVESSPAAYALQPNAGSPQDGPLPAGYTTAPYILPFIPDRDGAEEETSVQLKRDQIGLLREQQNTFYPQSAERYAKFSFTLGGTMAGGATASTSPTPAQMMEFFLATMAPGDAFWCPSSLQCLVLSRDALPTDTALNVADTSAVAVGDCIYIFPGNAAVAVARTITTINPGVSVTIDSPLGVPMPVVLPSSAGQTAIFPLLLVRLEKPQMKMMWLKPGLATVQLQFNEVPVEQFLPNNESLGATIGKLQVRVVLFQFTRDLGNGSVLNYYYTSFESDILWNGQTWSHAPFECGDITRSLNLQDDNVTITSYLFPGNPLIADLTKLAEAPLTVAIIFANYDGGLIRGAATMFTGDASAPSRDGNKIKIKCKMGPALLSSQLPIFLRGVQCSHLRGSNTSGLNLISAGCTGPDNIMLKINWKATAQVAGPLSAGFPFALNLLSLAGVGANVAAALADNAVFANWFANGYVEWGAGANIQRRIIVGSTVPAGGALTLTLHRYFNGGPGIGDSVSLYPGCDGLYTTCRAFDTSLNPTGKFNNYQNFGGQPFTPISNPSMAGLKQFGVQGTKK
jgi:hypothetical protein